MSEVPDVLAVSLKSWSVSAFVKSDRPARYPGLRIKYVRGADPVIKLMDEEERVQEVSGQAAALGGMMVPKLTWAPSSREADGDERREIHRSGQGRDIQKSKGRASRGAGGDGTSTGAGRDATTKELAGTRPSEERPKTDIKRMGWDGTYRGAGGDGTYRGVGRDGTFTGAGTVHPESGQRRTNRGEPETVHPEERAGTGPPEDLLRSSHSNWEGAADPADRPVMVVSIF